MSRISSATGLTLDLVSTLDEPTHDPGLRMKLKRGYSGQECFDKFHPYLVWLRSFISRNKWVSKDIVTQFEALWDTYTVQESRLGKVTVVKEFFSQKAHGEVEHLWRRYRALRKEIEDLATQRVTLRAAQAADSMASTVLRSQSWSARATAVKSIASPESSPDESSDPFANPEDD